MIEFIIGLIIFFLVFWKDREVLRVDFKAVQKFLWLMVGLTFIRLFLFSVASEFDVYINEINQGINHVKFWKLGLVFWEDAFFAIPIYYMIDKWKWKEYLYLPIIAALSIRFGIGHIYQAEPAYFATLIIPYVVFYQFGKRFGFGTTMICHTLFDMITIITFKLTPLMI
jgi:hypothetical protein